MPSSKTFDEICKISAVKATSALSKFLQLPIAVNMKQAEIEQSIANLFVQNQNEASINIFMPITGDLSGGCFFLYAPDSALALCDTLFRRAPGASDEFNQEEISALDEVANIVIGNFLSCFADCFQIPFLMHRSPKFNLGPLGPELSRVMAELPGNTGELTVNVSFSFEHTAIRGYVLIVFEEQKLKKYLKDLADLAD